MVDFSQWYDLSDAFQQSLRWMGGGMLLAIAVVFGVVMFFAVILPGFAYDIEDEKAREKTQLKASIGFLVSLVLLVAAYMCVAMREIASLPRCENSCSLSEHIERTFDISVEKGSEDDPNMFTRDTFEIHDGVYNIIYIDNGTQHLTEGELIVKDHSIGITDSNGTFLKGEYK